MIDTFSIFFERTTTGWRVHVLERRPIAHGPDAAVVDLYGNRHAESFAMPLATTDNLIDLALRSAEVGDRDAIDLATSAGRGDFEAKIACTIKIALYGAGP